MKLNFEIMKALNKKLEVGSQKSEVGGRKISSFFEFLILVFQFFSFSITTFLTNKIQTTFSIQEKFNNKYPFQFKGFILLLLLLFFVSACYEKKEGCLDINATNFDVIADNECLDCCTYPNLTVEVSHVYRDTAFRYNTLFQVDTLSDIYFTVQEMSFYLSDFHFKNNQQTVGVQNTVELEVNGNSGLEKIVVEDNFNIVSKSAFSYPLGEFRSTGSFDSLQFNVGLTPLINQTLPSSLASNHPLSYSSDSSNWDMDLAYTFIEIELKIVPDTSMIDIGDTLILKITGDENMKQITLPYLKKIDIGRNTTIPLQIDYAKWFEGIDFVGDTDDKIKEDIINNTTQVFSIFEE